MGYRLRVIGYGLVVALLCGCASQKISKRSETQWHTMQAKNVRTTLWVDQKTYTVNCTYQAVRDSMIVVSVRPLLGIEVARIEATPKQIVVIDKVHAEYTPVNYKTLNLVVKPHVTYKTLQEFVSGKGTDKENLFAAQLYCSVGRNAHLVLNEVQDFGTKTISVIWNGIRR